MSETGDDRRIPFHEITWPNGQVELHPVGGGEPFVTRTPFVPIEVPRDFTAGIVRQAGFGTAESRERMARILEALGDATDYREQLTQLSYAEQRELVGLHAELEQTRYEAEEQVRTVRLLMERGREDAAELHELFNGTPLAQRPLMQLAAREIVRLRKELADLRAAAGWSTDNSPTIGGNP